jgi:DNA anti-recombination protein RmuC
MVVNERARHELFGRLEDALGAEHAVTLMEHLPPVGWADVATKHDLAVLKRDLDALEKRLNLRIDSGIGSVRQELDSGIGSVRQELGSEISSVRQELGSEISSLRQELRSEISSLRQELGSEISSLRQELGSEISSLRQELRSEISSVRREMGEMKQEVVALLRAEISSALTTQTKTLMFTVLGALTSMTALLLSAGRF